jgi:hypothetical protein
MEEVAINAMAGSKQILTNLYNQYFKPTNLDPQKVLQSMKSTGIGQVPKK